MIPDRPRKHGTSSRLTTALFIVLAGCSSDSTAAPAIASMVLSQSNFAVGLGATLKVEVLSYTGSGDIVTPGTIVWSSSNNAIATVDANGTVLGVALGGPVHITAKVGLLAASATASVVPARVAIAPATDVLAVGATVQFTATAQDFAGSPISAGAVTWSTSDAAIATVTQSGVVTAITPGLFVVFATIAGKRGELAIGVPGPFDGSWSGADAAGRAMQFEIRFSNISQFQMPNVTLRTECKTDLRLLSVNAPIVNDQFTFSFPGPANTGAVTGTFTSTGTMTGTHQAISVFNFTCPNGTIFNGVVGASTFTATK